jgi:hypothetical protein
MEEEKRSFLLLDHFSLKIIAGFLMTLDHIGLFFFPSTSAAYLILRSMGTLSFPLFAFLAIEGVYKSHNSYLYALRLIVLGGLLDLATYLSVRQYGGNALTELGLGVLSCSLLKEKNWKAALSLLPMSLMVLADFSFFPLRMEFGTIGLLEMLAFFFAIQAGQAYFRRLSEELGIDAEEGYGPMKSQLVFNGFSIGFLVFVDLVLFFLYTYFSSSFLFVNFYSYSIEEYGLLSVFLIFFYSGKKGFSNKWVNASFYAYYPLHILLFWLLRFLLNIQG